MSGPIPLGPPPSSLAAARPATAGRGRGRGSTVRGGVHKRGIGRGGSARRVSGGREGREEDWSLLEGSSHVADRPPEIGPPPTAPLQKQRPAPPAPAPRARGAANAKNQANGSASGTSNNSLVPPPPPSRRPAAPPNRNAAQSKSAQPSKSAPPSDPDQSTGSKADKKAKKNKRKKKAAKSAAEIPAATAETAASLRRAYSNNRSFAAIREDRGARPVEQGTFIKPFPVTRFSQFGPAQIRTSPPTPPDSPQLIRPAHLQARPAPLLPRARHAAYNDMEDSMMEDYEVEDTPLADEGPSKRVARRPKPVTPPRPLIENDTENARYSPSRPAANLSLEGAATEERSTNDVPERTARRRELARMIDEKGGNSIASESEPEVSSEGGERREGCEWRPMPENCSRRGEPNQGRRDANRGKLGALWTKELSKQSRRVWRILWRDDGCGLDWVSIPRETQTPSAPTSRSGSRAPSRASSRSTIVLSHPTPFSIRASPPGRQMAPSPASRQASPAPTVISISSNSDVDMDADTDLESRSDSDSDSDSAMSTSDEEESRQMRAGPNSSRQSIQLARPSSPAAVERTFLRITDTVKRPPVAQANDKLRFMCHCNKHLIMTFSSRALIQIYEPQTLDHSSRPGHQPLMPSGHIVQAGAFVAHDFFVMTTERPKFKQDQLICARISRKSIQYSFLHNPQGECRLDSICKSSQGQFLTGGPSARGEHVVSRWKFFERHGQQPHLELDGLVLPIHHKHVNTVTSIAYSAATQHMISGSLDTKAIIWDLTANGEVKTISAGKPVHQVHVCDYSGGFLTALELAGGEYEIHDSRQSKRVRNFGWGPNAGLASKSRFAKGSFNGIYFTSGHATKDQIKVWDIRNTSAPIVSQTLTFAKDARDKSEDSGLRQVMMDGQRIFAMSKSRLIRHDFQWKH